MIRSIRWCVMALGLPGLLSAQDLSRRLAPLLPGRDTLVSVAFFQPATGRHAWIRADTRVHAASTMKVPVLIELARRVDAGDLHWGDSLTVTNTFHSIVDSSLYTLDAGDDSDSLPYTYIGRQMTVEELARRMIVRSSNLATNVLIAQLDARRVTATAHALGADSVEVLRGVEDGVAYQRGMNNTLTARGLAQLYQAILSGRAASAASTQRILGILAGQQFNAGIPSGLPAGTLVVHKTGWITAVSHDAAIVYPAGAPPYILVILTKGYATEPEAEAVMGRIAAAVNTLATGH